MLKNDYYNVGTLIWDMGKIGVICRLIETGKLNTANAMINWRFNYEIYYVDGTITVMGHDTLERLIQLCMVLHCMGSRIQHLEDYFMVYSITNKEKFMVTRQFMKKIG